FSVGERLGRKKSIILSSSFIAIGPAAQIYLCGVLHVILGYIRVQLETHEVSGFFHSYSCIIGNDIDTASAPVWQMETLYAQWRGKLVMIEVMMNIFQFMLVN
ncbi:uncharacterized protein BCR38DRAFT_353790, partial [Pseudomassariella vexata]